MSDVVVLLHAAREPLLAPLDGAVPVTVLWGDRDRFTPYRSQAARARRLLPHSHHVTLVGCGHVPTYDDPDQVVRAVIASIA